MTWSFEIIDKKTNEVLLTDYGYASESEAEFYANMDIKLHNLSNCYVRTFPKVQ